MKRTTAALCLATVAALALGGCAQSDSDGAGSADGNTDASNPIKLRMIYSLTGAAGIDKTAPQAALAAAKAINDAGGINGRMVTVTTCDTASDPNKSADCARKAVSDKVDAVVGMFDPFGIAATLPIFEAGKIPLIGSAGIIPPEFTSEISFPLTGGAPGGLYGAAASVLDAGCKSVVTWGDTAADQGQTEGFVALLKSKGVDASYVELPTGTADVTPMVAEALSDDPDCVAYTAGGQVAAQLFTAVRRAGSKAQIFTTTQTLLPPFLEALGDDANGIKGVTTGPSVDDPTLQPFRDDMQKYASATTINDFTYGGWLAVEAAAEVAKSVDGEVNAASLLDALNSTTDLELAGLPPLDFTKDSGSKVYPRMFNANVKYVTVKDGAWTFDNNDWHSLEAVLS